MIDAQRRTLAAFYTPSATAEALAEWAIRDGKERVLEPSVGEGALLNAALRRARHFAPSAEIPKAFACDIDPVPIQALRSELGESTDLIVRDFFELDPTRTPTFDVVIANPPFTRNHALPPLRRQDLRRRFEVKGPVGLWVYFLLHGIRFLAPGGRLASVVPGSTIFTKYGREFVERICERFARVDLYQLDEKPAWQGGADDRGAIILAEGYQRGPCPTPKAGVWNSSGIALGNSPKMPTAYADLANAAKQLGDIAQLSIGAVTGANKHFLLCEAERASLELDLEHLRPIVSRARHITGLTITRVDLDDLSRRGEKTWLLSPPDINRRGSAPRARLAQISRKKRRNTLWLNKRTPWWRVDTGPDCDAVFTYMNHRGPRLALAEPGITCTNTLHRVVFLPEISGDERASAALTFVSTFGQCAAEGIGRVYGGGVLKFELAEARRMPVLLAPINGAESYVRKVNTALRSGAYDVARNLADEALTPMFIGRGWRTAVAELTGVLESFRSARRNGKAVHRHL